MSYTHYSRSELQELLMKETKNYTSALRTKSHEELRRLSGKIEGIQVALAAIERDISGTGHKNHDQRSDNDQIRP